MVSNYGTFMAVVEKPCAVSCGTDGRVLLAWGQRGRSVRMQTMSISKFKATCLAALERVRKTGEPLLITKRGVPMAQVLPAPPPAPHAESAFGCMAGTAEEVEDIVAPLLAEEWEVLR
jgi:prevent-host-death family protein